MVKITSADFLTQGVKLHYYRTGGEKPALVLVHGITDDGLCWTPLAEALAEKFDIVMVDLRAHGKSDAPDDGYTIENLANELAGLIQGLGLDRPVILGHSLGASATLTLAGMYPDLPGAIILEDPPVLWSQAARPHADAEFHRGFAGWIASNKRKTRDDLLAECRSNSPTWPEAELEPWVNAKHRYSLKVVKLIYPQASETIDFARLLRRVRCPVLLISADVARGAISRDEDVAELKELIPQLQFIRMADAGHNIRREQFTPYLEIVVKFGSR